MIGFIKGQIIDINNTSILLEVNGVGYEIHMPQTALQGLPKESEIVKVFTHLILKDDKITLYGFLEKEDLDIFKVLLEVSGVGPRLALNILSVIPPGQLLEDISRGEYARLKSVHGVGKKTAARICVDLKEKALKLLSEKGQIISSKNENQIIHESEQGTTEDAMSALLNLGYTPKEAKKAIRAVLSEKGQIQLDELIRASLNLLSKVR